jgi:hypothetical protein
MWCVPFFTPALDHKATLTVNDIREHSPVHARNDGCAPAKRGRRGHGELFKPGISGG